MHEAASEQWTLIIVGAALLAGFVAHVVGRRAHVPRVTLLLVIGVVTGPSVLDIIPHEVEVWFPHVSSAALSLIGFMLGQHFKAHELLKVGRVVLVASLAGTIVPALVVAAGLWTMTSAPLIALLLAAAASATDPAAVVDVVKELNARGPLSKTTLGVTAIDDAWAVLLFTLVLACAPLFAGESFRRSRACSRVWRSGRRWRTSRVITGERSTPSRARWTRSSSCSSCSPASS